MDGERQYTNRRLTRRQRQQCKIPAELGKARVMARSNRWRRRQFGLALCLPCAAAWVNDGTGEWETGLLPVGVEPGEECQCRWSDCTYAWVRGKCGHSGLGNF